MIQPGLIPLQSNLDFMDTFEPFQGEDLRQRKSLRLPLPRTEWTGLPFHRGELLEWARERS